MLLQETSALENGEQQRRTYYFEPGTFKPIALNHNGQVYHYHLDHLGTPDTLTNEQGDIAWSVSYRSYGNVALAQVNDIDQPLRFQGQYFDEESGLHYNRFRYYDPRVGLFTQQDPIGLAGGENAYLYCPDPFHWIDPFGLTPNEVFSICPKKAKEELAAGKTTQEVYQKDGVWDKDRQELHHDLVQEKLNRVAGLGESVEEPSVFAIRGNSGSGKSRFVNSGGVKGVDNMDDIAVVNPDEFKELLIKNTDVPVTHRQVHTESSMLAKKVQANLLEQTDANGKPTSFMVDKRLGDVEDIEDLAKAAQSSGRKLNVSDMDAPLEHSLIGVLMRKPGGADPIVPFEVVGEGGFKPARSNRKATMDIFEKNPELGTYELYGTTPSGDKKLIAKIENGKKTVLDKDEYLKLTDDPDVEIANLKNTVIDDAEIARITDPLPEGAWKNDVKATLTKGKGKTWSQAIEDHGKL